MLEYIERIKSLKISKQTTVQVYNSEFLKDFSRSPLTGHSSAERLEQKRPGHLLVLRFDQGTARTDPPFRLTEGQEVSYFLGLTLYEP